MRQVKQLELTILEDLTSGENHLLNRSSRFSSGDNSAHFFSTINWLLPFLRLSANRRPGIRRWWIFHSNAEVFTGLLTLPAGSLI